MSSPDMQSNQGSPPSRDRRKQIGIVVAAVAVIVGAGAVGWWLNDASDSANHDVTVTDTFTGKVTLRSADGTAGCVQPTNDQPKVCSIFATFGGAVNVGDTVHVAHEHFQDSHGNGYDWLLIVPAQSPG